MKNETRWLYPCHKHVFPYVIFPFRFSAFDMVQTCISGLNSTELNECVPKKEQKEFSAVMGAMDRIVCTKDERKFSES